MIVGEKVHTLIGNGIVEQIFEGHPQWSHSVYVRVKIFGCKGSHIFAACEVFTRQEWNKVKVGLN